jgi:hypothetical protein
MADKPVLVSITWAHIIFRFFETFCEHESCSKLRGKKKAFFGPMFQKLWMFEVSRRSLGKASMCWSHQQELTTCAKNGGQEEKKIQEK